MLTDQSIWENIARPARFTLISGPCVIESEELCLEIGETLKKICADLGIHYIFKASFDKANRSSSKSFRGPGISEGLEILSRIRTKLEVPVVTDVHTEEQAVQAANHVDVLQIPAFLCRQTDLLEAAARTGKIVNVKKGQFLAPQDMKQVVNKMEAAGCRKLALTERGTTFGYNNLVSDMRSIPIMKRFNYPVIFDATHSVQLPGGAGETSSGQREFAPVLAKAAMVVGADGVFIETHPEPDQALSDGPNMIPLGEMKRLLQQLVRLQEAARNG